jgi:outer membrane receptor for ferrienterochelin and colicins
MILFSLLVAALAHATPDEDSVDAPVADPVEDSADPPAEESPPAVRDEAPAEIVVVTATRTPIPLGKGPLPVVVIDREDIELSGAEDLAGILAQAPGVDIDRSYLGATVRLRGLDPDQVLILIDGQRVLGRKGGAQDLSRIPLESIDRIEIVEGAAAALYGSDAMAGVIHIHTRAPKAALEAEGHARGGTLGTADVDTSVGWSNEGSAGRVGVALHANGAFDRDSSDAASTIPEVRQVSTTLDLMLEPSSNVDVNIDGSYVVTDARAVGLGTGGAVLDRRNLTEDARLSVRPMLGEPGNGLSAQISAGLYRDQYLSDQRGAAALDTYEETRETIGQLQVQGDRTLGEHTLTAAFDSLVESMESARIVGTGQRQRMGLVAQDVWTHEGSVRLQVVPSARVDVDSQFGSWPTGRMAVRVDPHPRLALQASGGSGFRAPTFRELYLNFDNSAVGYRVDGSTDLKPERSVGVAGGTTWTGESLWWGLRGSHDVLVNLITTDLIETGNGPDRYGYVNVNEAQSTGGTATLGINPSSVFEVDGSYTLTLARDTQAERLLTGRAPHRGTVALRVGPPTTVLNIRAGIEGPRPFYPDADGDGYVETEWMDAWAGVDLTMTQRLAPGWTCTVGVENLLDAGDANRLPIPPRMVHAGIRGRWSGSPGESQ